MRRTTARPFILNSHFLFIFHLFFPFIFTPQFYQSVFRLFTLMSYFRKRTSDNREKRYVKASPARHPTSFADLSAHLVNIAFPGHAQRLEADAHGVVAVLLDGAFLLERRDAVAIRHLFAKIELLLADSAEVARCQVAQLLQLDELGVRELRLEHAFEEEALAALEKKAMGSIRATISNAAHPSQSLLLEALKDPDFAKEKEEKFQVLKGRALEVKRVLAANDRFREVWEAYPFNSGYFMCLKLKNANAEALRLHLLENYGVGTIAVNATDLRVTFSCIAKENIAELFELLYQGAITLGR